MNTRLKFTWDFVTNEQDCVELGISRGDVWGNDWMASVSLCLGLSENWLRELDTTYQRGVDLERRSTVRRGLRSNLTAKPGQSTAENACI